MSDVVRITMETEDALARGKALVSDIRALLQKARQPVAKFDESQHPRHPEGSTEGGRFAETGRGAVASDPRLAKEAEVGIAAVEKLIPEALKTANFSGVLPSWEELTAETQNAVHKYYSEKTYDDVDIDSYDADLTVDVRWSLVEGATPETAKMMVEKTKSWLKGRLADEPMDEFALDKSQSGGKPLNHATVSVPDPTKLTDAGYPVIDLMALRHMDDTPLTPLERDHVRGMWANEYKKVVQDEIEKAQDSDEYLGKREALIKEEVEKRWHKLTGPELVALIPAMIAHEGKFTEQDNPYYFKAKTFVPDFNSWGRLTPTSQDEVFQVWQQERKKALSIFPHKEGPSGEDYEVSRTLFEKINDVTRLDIAKKYMKEGKLHGPQFEPQLVTEPKPWVTGASTGTLEDVNYQKTHELALRLTELRTEQLRKERGLIQTGEKPGYKIIPNYGRNKNFVIQDMNGVIIGASNTLEQATLNAEEWAAQVSVSGHVSTEVLIQDVWKAWKTKSSTGLSLSLQLAAAQELGGHHRMTPYELAEAEQFAGNYGGLPTLQAYVRAQWEVTQLVMHKAGEDQIDLYRGLMLSGEDLKKTKHQVVSRSGEVVEATNVKVVQTDFDPKVSYDFGGQHYEVSQRRIPGAMVWDMADATVQASVKENFVKQSPLSKQKEVGEAFDIFPEHTKSEMLREFRSRGVLPPLPYESVEATLQRELDSYLKGGYDAFLKLPQLALQRAGAQSTTGDIAVANDWGGVGELPLDPVRVVLRVTAPPTSVLSLPIYGQNVVEEHESVLLGTKDRWLWDAWQDHAPPFSVVPVGTMTRKADFKPLVIDLQAEDRGKPHWLSKVPPTPPKAGISFKSVLKFDESQHPRDEEGQFTRVGITSQRPADDPGHQSNKDVFKAMKVFDGQLRAIPGVTHVSVKPGVGGWDGGSESMWQVYYKGNGEARKLVARTAKQFNQDSVLILNKCKGKDCQPNVELSFQEAVSPTTRELVHKVLTTHGVTGWTWMKRDGKTLLRMVSVPQWGYEPVQHQKNTIVISEILRSKGLANKRRVHKVAVTVMEREGAHNYDSVINES